jgi:tetratricopeptide (TPR) repeat protein
MNHFLSIVFLLTSIHDLNPAEVQDLIITGLDHAYIEEFDQAVAYFDRIIERDPANPAGYFFKAALLQVKMMDQCRFDHEKEYLALMNQTIRCAEEILKQEDNPWANLYLGNSYTYRAVYEGIKNNYFETFRYGVKGGRILQEIIKADSLFYEAYLGAGSFEYFWARAARYLPILKLMGGDADEAIRKIHVAAEKSLYSGPTARNSLIFIYGEENEYDKALRICDSLLIDYPRSRAFLWSKAGLLFKKKDYATSVVLYDSLYNMYIPEDNYANLAQCRLFAGKCYVELKEIEKAKAALKDVVGFKAYDDIYPPIKKYCREAYGLLSRLL